MRESAQQFLEKVGLMQWQDHLATNISGAQRPRIAIARAWTSQSPLVPDDEPTGNLDTESADSVFELMRQISVSSGTTFLFVTYNMALAQRRDRIVELIDWRILVNA